MQPKPVYDCPDPATETEQERRARLVKKFLEIVPNDLLCEVLRPAYQRGLELEAQEPGETDHAA